MTKYIYKGKEISHLAFISLMKSNGLESGYRCGHYDHLKDLAEKGIAKAQGILADLVVIKK